MTRYANSETTISQGVATTTYKEQDPLNTGIQLTVIPHICGDSGDVVIEVIPVKSKLEGWEDYGLDPVTGLPVMRLPQTSITTVVTKMMLKSGNTGVISGLVVKEDSVHETSVPLLGKLPAVGWAFKRKEKTRRKLNLMIFVTPKIIGESAREELDDEIKDIRDMAAEMPGMVMAKEE